MKTWGRMQFRVFAAGLLLCATLATAQQRITVMESSTLDGVADVTVVNPRSGYSTLTDAAGVAVIERTAPEDTLYIQHLAYYPERLTLAQIMAPVINPPPARTHPQAPSVPSKSSDA